MVAEIEEIVNDASEQSSDDSTVQESAKGKMFFYVPSSVRKATGFDLMKGDTVTMTVMSDGEVRIRRRAAHDSAAVKQGAVQE